MSKTQSQTRNATIKKEEEDYKPSPGLNGVALTTKSKIIKPRPSKSNSSILSAPDIKVEEDTDIKSLLQSASNYSKLPKKRYISQEQINQLIGYIANDNMGITEAAQKAKISYTTGLHYYKVYKNDPEKKIPSPRNQLMHPPISPTQEQIENLIRYIKNDKMSLTEASEKANMSYQSGRHYYNRYLKDPDHKIPIPPSRRNYTQDQKNKLIGYIVDDKMSIKAASKKASINYSTGKIYYKKYLGDQKL